MLVDNDQIDAELSEVKAEILDRCDSTININPSQVLDIAALMIVIERHVIREMKAIRQLEIYE